MKLLLSPFPFNQTLLFFFVLFLSSSTLIINNSQQFTIQSDLDEDITILPSDENRRQFDSEQPLSDEALQTNHVKGNYLNSNNNNNNDDDDQTTINKNLYSLKQSSSVEPSNGQFDPFSVTFEDYLKEASKSFAHHLLQQESHDTNSKPVHQPAATTSSSATSTTEYPINSQPSFIIEEEDNLIKPKESQPNIDNFFPRTDTNRFTAAATSDRKSVSDNERVEIVEPEDETPVRVQFTWRQHTTNKCSRSCGRGFKLFHYYCIDLKYGVRVSDENCLNSNLKKPNATSEETCNEFDCPPQWSSIEFKEIGRSFNCQPNELECQPNANQDLYKRIQCMMIDKKGNQIYLDDSKCNESNDVQSLSLTSSHINNEQHPMGESVESLGFHGSIAAAINVLGGLLKKTSDQDDSDETLNKLKLKYDEGFDGYKINQYQHVGESSILLPNYDTQLPKGYVIQIKSRGRNKQPQVKIIKAKRHSRSHRLLNRKLGQ